MVQPYDAPDIPGQVHSIGCAGRVTAFSETEDGRYMITLSGQSRFRIKAEVEGFTPYRRFSVNWAGFEQDTGPAERDMSLDRDKFFHILSRFFDDRGLKTDWESLREADDELLINSLSMLCPFAPEDKQALLEAPSLVTRRETLVTLIEFALRGGSDEEVMQ
jgi:Lon protease-like protein